MIGIFRYDDEGRLAEEWVQTDYRSFLTKLGVNGRVRPTGVVAVRASPRCLDTPTLAPAGPAALNGPSLGHGAAGPRDANLLRASGSNLPSLRRPLIVLAIGTFAIGTDAFVIGGVLPAVAASSSTSFCEDPPDRWGCTGSRTRLVRAKDPSLRPLCHADRVRDHCPGHCKRKVIGCGQGF